MHQRATGDIVAQTGEPQRFMDELRALVLRYNNVVTAPGLSDPHRDQEAGPALPDEPPAHP